MDDEETVRDQVTSSAFWTVTDSIIDTHSAVKVLAVTVTAEFAAFAMLYVSKDKVQEVLADSDNDAWFYGSIAFFLIGFLTTFAVHRIFTGSLRRGSPKYTIFLLAICVAAGLANIALFFVLISFQLQ